MKITRDVFEGLVKREDEVGAHAIGRALVHLLRRQTTEEAASNTTRTHNLRGFTPADARRGCIHAKFYIKHKRLDAWMVEYWLKPNAKGTSRIGKYWSQINEESQRIQAARQEEKTA